MILAAGLGTRLRPLTNKLPKALLPVAGTPMLEILLRKMERAGYTQVAVNAHHFASQLENFLEHFQPSTSMQIYYSYEATILDTGGGIKKMLEFYLDETPILVHNVDVVTAMDYRALYQFHRDAGIRATLVVNKRKTARPLAFDVNNQLLGKATPSAEKNGLKFGFCGIQVIQPSLFRTIAHDIFYSIDVFVDAARAGSVIKGYDISGFYWRDIGTLEDLERIERDIKEGIFKLS